MATHNHLTIEDREKIQEMIWERESVRSVARVLSRSPSTISREINNNVPEGQKRYTPRLAQERARAHQEKKSRRARLKSEFIRTFVIEKLRLRWSPEQIAGILASHYHQHISHEAIYQFIYHQYHRGGNGRCVGLDLVPCLRRRHKRRHRKYVPFKEKRTIIKDKTSIEDRPHYIEKRKQLGHWETDSMVSRQSTVALNTLVERASGFVRISKVPDTTAIETRKVLVNRLGPLPLHLRRTITSDNGHEFAEHLVVSKELIAKFYFCHTYASWERGTNENTNGLIRDYFPKKTDFAILSDEEIQKVEHLLNTRPRKRLGWKTPLQIFKQGVALESGI